MPDLLLLAAGGHGRVVLDTLQCAGVPVAGILDPGLRAGALVLGVPVLGGDERLEHRDPDSVRLVNGAGLRPDRGVRQRLFETWTSRGFGFVPVRHPSAVVSPAASLGDGSQVLAGAVIQCGARIGRNVVLNTRASVDHDCIVHDHAFLAPGVVLCGQVTKAPSSTRARSCCPAGRSAGGRWSLPAPS
jgi:UDP-perosamine 4-acetyltransferase